MTASASDGLSSTSTNIVHGERDRQTYSETDSVKGGYREATTGTAGVAFRVRFKYRRMWSRLDTNLTGTACQQYRVTSIRTNRKIDFSVNL